MKGSIRAALTGWSLLLPAMRRSLWVHGDHMIDFLVAEKLIRSILDERPHLGLVVTAAKHEVMRSLARLFPDEQILAMPHRLTLGRWLNTLQVRHLLLLDAGRSLPTGLLRAVANQNLPISAVNLSDAGSLSDELLEISCRKAACVHLCVHDAAVSDDLVATGLPSRLIHETGWLFGDRDDDPLSGERLRRRLAISDQRPIAALLDVPAAEESALIAAYARARELQPRLRLLWESRDAGRSAAVRRQLEERGIRVTTTRMRKPEEAPGWEALITSEAGEAAALLPLATVVSVGGTHGGRPCGAVAAFAASRGQRTLIGACRDFTTVPWRILQQFPCMEAINIDRLPEALAEAESSGLRSRPPQVSGDAACRIQDALNAWLPPGPTLPGRAEHWRLPTWRDRMGRSKVWQLASRPLRRARIDSWDDLAEHLNHPQTVLCLGNGPSSEDPRLLSIPHDCLIRVNWRWQQRGFLVNPQIVFVGDPTTVQRVNNAILGFWNRSLEQGMLLRHLITRGFRRPRYITMERISASIRDTPWAARPTNGAMMIDAAVALRPARLIIAGIDCYRHPDGRYPGELLATNAYARVHTHATDMAIIRTALSNYDGELIVLSDALRSELTNAQR